jgi:hypothetical protein
MEHYITLFDSLYLPQGLSLHASLERHAKLFTLWVLCMDDTTHAILGRLELPHVRLLRLADVETEDLLRIKPTRTKGEYCWTVTPFAPRFVFEADATVERVTYLDADVWFRKTPAPIFREFEKSEKHVLITDHGYAPEFDLSAIRGQYCVQFMTFTRHGGEVVRKWWEQKCIEWCYGYYEDGKFGDQMYLDDWPERFCEYVHVLNQKEWMLAPWNAIRFPYGNAIAFHFHGLRLLKGEKVMLSDYYPLPKSLRDYLYIPYLSDLHASVSALKSIGYDPQIQSTSPNFLIKFKYLLRSIYFGVMDCRLVYDLGLLR